LRDRGEEEERCRSLSTDREPTIDEEHDFERSPLGPMYVSPLGGKCCEL
jgi:hypothetical protein